MERCWMPPDADYVKINCDVSWNPSGGLADLGVVCRDNYGLVKFIKEKGADSSVKSSSHSYPADVSYATKAARILNDVGISLKGIGGLTRQLLEQNTQRFDQISANQASCQVVNNINLFSQIRDNIYTILDSLNDVPEIMIQLPPLYAKLDERLASLFLPPRAHQQS
ncbi:hypothetical protein QQ045_007772 [Rhodiola kirilowii]